MIRSLHAARWLVLWLVLLGACGSGRAADAPRRTAVDQVARRLATPVSVSWDNTPLVRALASLSQSQQIAIVRDRRIDPTEPVSVSIDNEPLSGALAKIAAHVQAGYCQFGPVAYLGPRTTAERLRTLAALRAQDARKLPAEASRKYLSMRSSHWDHLARPRELIQGLAAEAGATLEHAERIPHDLWPATELPPLSLVDRLSLVAAQFDLTFEIDEKGKTIDLVAVPDEVLLSRSYLAGRDAHAAARRWAKELPRARIAAAGTTIQVEAPLEDHERIEAALKGKPARRITVTAGPQTYQLSIETAALDKVVEQLARQLDLEFAWDRAAIDAAGIAVDQLVSVKVAGASLDELLSAVSAGTGLEFERSGRRVRVKPRAARE